MRRAGIDIGSRTIKVAVADNSTLAETRITDTGVAPLTNATLLLKQCRYDTLVATGYGRHLLRDHLGCPVITEIKAYALGAHYLYPGCQTVIDIGGQDSKIIKVSSGQVEDFEMNDRCAAGTGRFLEVMAHALGFSIATLGEEALKAASAVTISSMCTVFAESEVVSLIARGEHPQSIALGLHQSILDRLMALMGRVGFTENIVFAGGVAKNSCIALLLEQKLGMKVFIPEEPQIVGALGAALVQPTKQEDSP